MTDAQKSLWRFLAGGSGELHHGDCVGADPKHTISPMNVAMASSYIPPQNYQGGWREVPRHLMRPERPYLERNRVMCANDRADRNPSRAQ